VIPTLTTEEWLKLVTPPVITAILGAIVGTLRERRKRDADERDRRRTRRLAQIETTHKYLVSFLASVSPGGSTVAAPQPGEYLDKDERLVGDAALYQDWLAAVVAGMGGRLTGSDLERVAALRGRLKKAFDEQRERAQRDQLPTLAPLDTAGTQPLLAEFYRLRRLASN
jgi:hypothetical protein